MTRAARLAVGIVSAGKVGSVLGAALAQAGHQVVAASAISDASLARVERLLPEARILPPDEVARVADLVLLAVPDDALADLVQGLVTTGALRPGHILVHTSGAHGLDVLRPAAELGALTAALHPIMTFTGHPEDVQRLTAAGIGVTAPDTDEAAWHVAEALAVEMGAEPVRVPDHARPLYHAALAHGANHLVTLIADCLEMLRAADVANAERVAGPLLSAALDNVLRHGDRALTGPVARGDVGTVNTHLSVLGERAPDIAPSYRAFARRTVHRAKASGMLDDATALKIQATLDHFSEGPKT